jgi:hypothetical protein
VLSRVFFSPGPGLGGGGGGGARLMNG